MKKNRRFNRTNSNVYSEDQRIVNPKIRNPSKNSIKRAGALHLQLVKYARAGDDFKQFHAFENEHAFMLAKIKLLKCSKGEHDKVYEESGNRVTGDKKESGRVMCDVCEAILN